MSPRGVKQEPVLITGSISLWMDLHETVYNDPFCPEQESYRYPIILNIYWNYTEFMMSTKTRVNMAVSFGINAQRLLLPEDERQVCVGFL